MTFSRRAVLIGAAAVGAVAVLPSAAAISGTGIFVAGVDVSHYKDLTVICTANVERALGPLGEVMAIVRSFDILTFPALTADVPAVQDGVAQARRTFQRGADVAAR